MKAIKPGSVILIPKENTMGFYTILNDLVEKQFGDNQVAKFVAKLLIDQFSKVIRHNYMHAELYLKNGWQIGAWLNGVHTWHPPLSYYTSVHIYEPTFEFDEKKFFEAVKKYKESKYDFASLVLNTIVEVWALGSDVTESSLEDAFAKYYKNEDQLICSELVGRVYKDLGIQIERDPEYLTPDDIAQSPLFRRVY